MHMLSSIHCDADDLVFEIEVFGTKLRLPVLESFLRFQGLSENDQ